MNVERDYGVRADQVVYLIRTHLAGVVSMHTMRGDLGTLLFLGDVVPEELLHRVYAAGQKERVNLEKEVKKLRKKLEEVRRRSKEKPPDTSAARINGLIRAEVKRIREEYKIGNGKLPFDLEKLDFEAEEKKLNPALVQWFDRVTYNQARVDQHRKFGHQARAPVETDFLERKRKLRIFFAMCVLIFATNPAAKHPLQVALGEAIEALSGSETLLTMLNRIGATVSKDTLNRFITTAGKRIIVEGPFAQLPLGYEAAFVVASGDNLDKGTPTSIRHFGKHAADMHVITCQIHCRKSIPIPPKAQCAAGEARDAADHSRGAMAAEDSHLGKRARTLTEGGGQLGTWQGSTQALSSVDLGGASEWQGPFTDLRRSGKTAEQILETDEGEKAEYRRFDSTLFQNVLRRERTSIEGKARASFRDELAQQAEHRQPALEQSRIVYVAMWPLKASNREEFSESLFKIKEALQVGTRMKELVVVGDQQTWKHMTELKNEFPSDFSWLYPLPGDWHTLYNAQPVFKKVFWDAGLKNLASEMGCPETGALGESRNFRKNHHFLIQVWEAMYRLQLKHFLSAKGYERATHGVEELERELEGGHANVGDLPADCNLEARVREVLAVVGKDLKGLESDFLAWGGRLASVNKTWAFWWRFVQTDIKAYVGLWLAIRSGSWDLRCAAYKMLAPLFWAYDRTHYQQLVPLHLAHLLQWPEHLVDALRRGLWSVSLNCRPYRNFALDEAHESCINRDLKTSLSRILGPDSLVLRTNWLHKRGLIVKNLRQLEL